MEKLRIDITKTQQCEMSPLAGGCHWEFITKEGVSSCRWYEFPGVALTKHYNRGWLETKEMSSLTLLEAQSPRSQCQQGQAPSEASRERSVPGFSLSLAHESTVPVSTWHFPCVGVSGSKFPFIRTSVMLD